MAPKPKRRPRPTVGGAGDDDSQPFNILGPPVNRLTATSVTAPSAKKKPKVSDGKVRRGRCCAKADSNHISWVEFGVEVPELAEAFKWADKFVRSLVQHMGATLWPLVR